MKSILIIPMLMAGLALSAWEPGTTSSGPLELMQAPVVDPVISPNAGLRVSTADAHQMIQAREDRLNPTAKRRDLATNPGAVQGWYVNRKALQALLDVMKNKTGNAPIFIVLGQTQDLDLLGNPIIGSWHETLILSESMPFSLSESPDDFVLQHTGTWP
jgi:hypothetical protein